MAAPRRNHLKIRFKNSKYAFYKNNRRTVKVTPSQKDKEIDYCFLVNEIDKYGFDFFPDHYVRDNVRLLEKFAK